MTFLGDNAMLFHANGVIHHASWMEKAIYCLKIYIFRNEFAININEKNRLRDICIFIVTVYIEAWLKASYQDLLFIRKFYNYSSIDVNISRIALNKFRNNLWYITPEAVALAFFDTNIFCSIKTNND